MVLPADAWLSGFSLTITIPQAGELIIAPIEANFRGGTQFVIAGDTLDTTSISDDFSGGSLSALWTDVSVGGSVTPNPTTKTLRFDSSSTPGSTARIRTVASYADLDVAIIFSKISESRPLHLGADVFGELALYLSSTTRLALQGQLDNDGFKVVVETTVNGITSEINNIIARTAATISLRILRAGKTVYLFANGALFHTFDWFGDLAQIELGVQNDSAIATEIVSAASAYLRLPVVVFDTMPALDYLPSSAQLGTGTTPAVSPTLDLVDVHAMSTGTMAVLVPGGFTFTRESDLIRFADSQVLTVTNDPALTKRRAS